MIFVFAATGVTDGNMLQGVKRVNSTRRGSYAVTHSVVMRSTNKNSQTYHRRAQF